MTTTTRLLAAAAIALACAAPTQAASISYSTLYTFGDSLSDNGNLKALVGVPGAPYVDGRFSNGPVAAEYLARNLGIGLRDFAYGGAQTGNQPIATLGGPVDIGLLGQVASYGASVGGAADAQGLYMVFAGANDFLGGNLADPVPIITTAVTNLVTSVSMLYGMGARSFLLPLLPDLGATVRALNFGPDPDNNPLTPSPAQLLTGLSNAFNGTLMAQYGALAANLADANFILFDTAGAQRTLLAQFAAAGGNTTQACLATGTAPDCAGYYYFDDIHPTTAAHQATALALTNAVPEPASYGLAGLALLGAGLASRRRAARRG